MEKNKPKLETKTKPTNILLLTQSISWMTDQKKKESKPN